MLISCCEVNYLVSIPGTVEKKDLTITIIMTNNVYSYNNISYNTKRQTPGKAVVIRSYSCGEQL